jgi:hypothetical protein
LKIPPCGGARRGYAWYLGFALCVFINKSAAGQWENVMATWNLKELREKTSPFLDETERQDLSDLLDSFDWKSKATYYHLFQADECFKSFLETDDIEITKQVFSKNDDLVLAIQIREISLVSSVMTANTLPEVLAQVINILLSNKKIQVNDVTPNKLLKQISCETLKQRYRELLESDEYAYIKSFSNIIKHINLVKSDYHISFEKGMHGARFKAFTFKDQSFPETTDKDLIEIIKNFRSMCVELGTEINNGIEKLTHANPSAHQSIDKKKRAKHG